MHRALDRHPDLVAGVLTPKSNRPQNSHTPKRATQPSHEKERKKQGNRRLLAQTSRQMGYSFYATVVHYLDVAWADIAPQLEASGYATVYDYLQALDLAYQVLPGDIDEYDQDVPDILDAISNADVDRYYESDADRPTAASLRTAKHRAKNLLAAAHKPTEPLNPTKSEDDDQHQNGATDKEGETDKNQQVGPEQSATNDGDAQQEDEDINLLVARGLHDKRQRKARARQAKQRQEHLASQPARDLADDSHKKPRLESTWKIAKRNAIVILSEETVESYKLSRAATSVTITPAAPIAKIGLDPAHPIDCAVFLHSSDD
jgi:hypothetical protein